MDGPHRNRWHSARGRLSHRHPLGHFFRNYIDKAIVNWSGDKVADITQGMGGEFRTIQTGRIQQYMVLALVSIGVFGGFYYYVLPILAVISYFVGALMGCRTEIYLYGSE